MSGRAGYYQQRIGREKKLEELLGKTAVKSGPLTQQSPTGSCLLTFAVQERLMLQFKHLSKMIMTVAFAVWVSRVWSSDRALMVVSPVGL